MSPKSLKPALKIRNLFLLILKIWLFFLSTTVKLILTLSFVFRSKVSGSVRLAAPPALTNHFLIRLDENSGAKFGRYYSTFIGFVVSPSPVPPLLSPPPFEPPFPLELFPPPESPFEPSLLEEVYLFLTSITKS